MQLGERLQAALAGKYTIETELGGAGMSRVFLAEEVALERTDVSQQLQTDPPRASGGCEARPAWSSARPPTWRLSKAPASQAWITEWTFTPSAPSHTRCSLAISSFRVAPNRQRSPHTQATKFRTCGRSVPQRPM